MSNKAPGKWTSSVGGKPYGVDPSAEVQVTKDGNPTVAGGKPAAKIASYF